MFDTSTLWQELVGLVTLLLLSAFFSSSETAFLSSKRIRIRHLAEEGDKRAKIVQKMMKEPENVVSAIVIGNNIVNVAASAVATSVAISLFGNEGLGIAIGIMTFLILVVGEITPKGFAVKNAERLTLSFARPLFIVTRVLSPVATALNSIASIISRLIGGNIDKPPFLEGEEFKTFLTMAHEEGSLEEEERERLRNVYEFSDIIAREVMTPRTDMVGVDVTASLEEVRDIIVQTGFSRIPVYKENVDHIVGILYAKDLLQYLPGNDYTLGDIIRDPYPIPDTKKVDELLEEMQKRKVHLAIVVDEWGGTAGIVTIEDLIEEIVGEIFDEYDVTKIPIRRMDEDTVLFSGGVTIEEVNHVLAVNIPENGFETIGGFMLDQFGHLPKEGEKISFNGVDFIVFKTDGVRIMTVKAKISPQNNEKA